MKATITKITLRGKTLYAYVVGKSNNGLILYVQNRLIRVKDNNVEIIEVLILILMEHAQRAGKWNLQFDLELKKLEDERTTRAN